MLPMIDWEPTSKGNVKVLNDTADFYRYFDATAQSEFLYMCVEQTKDSILPREVTFLEYYDRFEKGITEIVEMPSSMIDLLHRFLHQNGGKLSSRAKTGEFTALTDEEAEEIEPPPSINMIMEMTASVEALINLGREATIIYPVLVSRLSVESLFPPSWETPDPR